MLLIDTLNNLGTEVNRRWPYINSGGCCVYAALVGAELLARDVKVHVVVGAHCAETADTLDITEGKNHVQNIGDPHEWNAIGVYFNHVGLEFRIGKKWFQYDSDGVMPRIHIIDIYPKYLGYLTVDDAAALAASEEGWNCMFDRGHIPTLTKYVKSFMAKKIPIIG
jgi:hypothetical protein